jgi:transcription elongation factor Elf1
MEEDVWSTTNKIKCKRCGQYNRIEKSIGRQAYDGQDEWFADFYTCSFCGHQGRRLTRLVAKIKDDGQERTYDNAEGAFYQTDVS